MIDIYIMRPEYVVYFENSEGKTRRVGSYDNRATADEVVNRIRTHHASPAWVKILWEEEII
jgi:hypothetical protein